MLIVFEIHVQPGFDPETLLSDETREETQARVLTREEAERFGLRGLPEPHPGGEVRYVPVEARHRRWIERALEASVAVTGFDVHDVGG